MSQKLVIETDVARQHRRTLGGDVVRAELPHYLSTFTPEITDQLLQTVGLQKNRTSSPSPSCCSTPPRATAPKPAWSAPKGEQLPTHHAVCRGIRGPRAQDGANELSLWLESAEVGGVR